MEHRVADVVAEPVHPKLTRSSDFEASGHRFSGDLPEHNQAATPRGVPSQFSNTLLSMAGTMSPKAVSDRGHQQHQSEHSEHVSARGTPRSLGAVRGQNTTMTDDPNDVWRRFVFGSDEPGSESERAAGATCYAVTLHDGDKTPSPKSVEGQCST